MDERDFDYRVGMKTAKNIKKAMGKGTWDKLTKAEVDALEDFLTELMIQIDAL